MASGVDRRAPRPHGLLACLVVALAAGVVGVGCTVTPASPTPIDPTRPPVTLTVLPGTVTATSTTAGTRFIYQACYHLINPPGSVRVSLPEKEFTPRGADDTAYPMLGSVGGSSLEAGQEWSTCTTFIADGATHPMATSYRLRIRYYMIDYPALLSVEGTSALTPR